MKFEFTKQAEVLIKEAFGGPRSSAFAKLDSATKGGPSKFDARHIKHVAKSPLPNKTFGNKAKVAPASKPKSDIIGKSSDGTVVRRGRSGSWPAPKGK